ncbi:hypothetical protein [Methylocystis bryophila]|uniref:hypothetical protein n=1 Tax=Methylocystis bryophila TaxID=655015 RepID=UPI001AEC81DC|nr:hypothetical protein [Methylocystis bryophila]
MGRRFAAGLGLIIALTCTVLSADDVVTVDDIANWRHPTKDVFSKWKIKLTKVDLLNHRVYPVFYVDGLPFDPMMGYENAKQMSRLEAELFAANGKHDYALELKQDNIRVNVTYNPATRTLEEEIIDHSSERK